MDLYGPLFRSVLWPAWEARLRGRPTVERLNRLRASQWRPLAELRREQRLALGRLLRHARKHVPFYRERLAEMRWSGDDVDLEQWGALPIVRTEEVRAPRAFARASTVAPRPTIMKSTSGTTGQPFVFGYEPDSEWWRQATKLRGYEWAKFRPGDTAFYLWGMPMTDTSSPARRLKIALDRRVRRETYASCSVLGEKDLRALVDALGRAQPSVLVCYTQAGAELARYVNRHGARRWRDMSVICGAERLYPQQRAELVSAFGPDVFESYGCREVMLIASECDAHDGLHVSMENLLVEIVVTEPDGTQRAAREGEQGEIVITDLHNLAMPFIRYANGDLGVAGSEGPAPAAAPSPGFVRWRGASPTRSATPTAPSSTACRSAICSSGSSTS